MTPTEQTTQTDERWKQWGDRLCAERDEQVADAKAALEEAEREIAYIREHLTLASAGQPYKRVGRVDGIDAATVFAAFAAIEKVALWKKYETEETE